MTAAKNTPVLATEFEAYQLCVQIKKQYGVQLGIVELEDGTYRVATLDQCRKEA